MGKGLDAALAQIKKVYGPEAIRKMSDHPGEVPAIPTGCLSFDIASGIGGVPRGRITEIFGPECIASDSFIQYAVYANGQKMNHKGGTIERLYERFHGLAPSGDGRGKGGKNLLHDCKFTAPAMNDQRRVIHDEILDVVLAGEKECFEICTVQGFRLRAAADHEFFYGEGFTPLHLLDVGERVFIHNKTPFRIEGRAVRKESNKNRAHLYVKHHGVAGVKYTGRYMYYRLKRSRAIIEAEMNELPLQIYIDRLNSGRLEGLVFLPREQNVHHEDEDAGNDRRDNLKVISAFDHAVLHAIERQDNLRFIATEDRIVEIVPVGPRKMYDLKMREPLHNYISNGFVVHNSGGKTTLALHLVAQVQAAGGQIGYVDVENALNADYAAALGVKLDDVYIAQPDNGEEGLTITETLIRSGEVDLVVVDSVDALLPQSVIDGEMEDRHVADLARLMSQGCRKLTAVVKRSKASLVFINQLRSKIATGPFAGGPGNVTSGGRALRYYASMRCEIKAIGQIKDSDDQQIGKRTQIEIVKNKCVAEGSSILDPLTGRVYRIEDVVEGRLPIHVACMDDKGKLIARPVVEFHDQGQQEVIGLRTKGGEAIYLTRDHLIFTDDGWRKAGTLKVGDCMARPYRYGQLGTFDPIPIDHARMLGYLIGDGYIGGKTHMTLTNIDPMVLADATAIAESSGCSTGPRRQGISFAHRPGESNDLLQLCRDADVWGKLAYEKTLPSSIFAADTSESVLINLLYGLLETDGYVAARDRRCGFCTTSEFLARQIQWLLLRLEIGSSLHIRKIYKGGVIDGRRILGKRICWETRISGLSDLERFYELMPNYASKEQRLGERLTEERSRRMSVSRRMYLSVKESERVWRYIKSSPAMTPRSIERVLVDVQWNVAQGLRKLLGGPRLYRDRIRRLGIAFNDDYLLRIVESDIYFATITKVLPVKTMRTFDLTVAEYPNFVVNDTIVHNCASPFKKAEFDLIFGKGIAFDHDLLDEAVKAKRIERSGAWFSWAGDRLGQGRDGAAKWLSEHPDEAAMLRSELLEEALPKQAEGEC